MVEELEALIIKLKKKYLNKNKNEETKSAQNDSTTVQIN